MISYTIDTEEGVVWTIASGVLTDDELLEHKRKLVQDPDFRPNMKELADVRAVERLEVTNEGIQRLVVQDRQDSSQVGGHRLAIVVSLDVAFGLARMYQTLTEQNIPNVRVFRDIDEAKDWLSI